MSLIQYKAITMPKYHGFVKGETFCFRYPYFYFRHGESTSIVSQQTYAASQLSKDLNKVPLLLQNLESNTYYTFVLFQLMFFFMQIKLVKYGQLSLHKSQNHWFKKERKSEDF